MNKPTLSSLKPVAIGALTVAAGAAGALSLIHI